ncbi:hypothetical protein ACFL1X_07410 [Candidatus Hydrogenedentota bacterium]
MKHVLCLTHKEVLLSRALLLILLGSVFLNAFLLLNTFHGDPSIYLIYARNIAQTDFFSFNPGEFSSGSTSPLWAVILSLAFFFPHSVYIAKLLSLLFTLVAILLTYMMSLKLSGSKTSSAVATFALLPFLAFPGLMLYESSLIICLVNLLIWFLHDILDNQISFSPRRIMFIGLVWAAIPLCRPDASIMVALSIATLVIALREEREHLLMLTLTLILALTPSFLYFGYSHVSLGTFSTSSLCRTLAFWEGSQDKSLRILGVALSTNPSRFFVAFPIIFWSGFAVWGWQSKYWKNESMPARWFLILAPLAHIVLLSIALPDCTPKEIERYILPVIPFLVSLSAIGLARLFGPSISRRRILCLAVLCLPFLCWSVQRATKESLKQRKRGLSFDVITERAVVEHLNEIAEPSATLLAYEVQTRYYLRSDLRLLSLDGITDGKVAPHLSKGDISSFLWKHKPNYWLANDAVFYRSYLAKGILNAAVIKTGDREGASVIIDDITFTNMRKRKEPSLKHFADYRQLYRLTYDSVARERKP